MSGVDVLAVMDAEIASAEALAISDAYQAERLQKVREARAAVVNLIQTSALLDAELEAAWNAGKIPFDATSGSTVRAFKDALANMQGGES